MSDDTGDARLVLATHNQGKVRELRAMLADAGLSDPGIVVDAGAVGLDDVVETGTTFQENALLKARAAAEQSGLIALADDSGLAVDILGGAPGIFSARWSGSHGDDAANLRLLLAQLADIAPEHRGARFVCAAAVVNPRGAEHVVLGELPGSLLTAPAGENGFGYDPVFAPHGENGLSCAQLTPEHKNRISHRARAMAAVLPRVLEFLQRETGHETSASSSTRSGRED
ncbi:non-canonical purine NTP pyrophosphatase, RdgB/HAM1 family [Kocuria tytonicola]|uniref:RdgB/HAM1 family non-canonical purine NTP pyrophosphatase n=1 Tax=Kocuria tytonicola TaxID=2055946 RepID=UPI000EF92FDE|nr:RdgB/HAM1 family non-canonical purine NTP pyrophosphatase [Kocuria tytonicola]RLZ03993.1 non-canonical purine NTP pyrophosphatase, RdgB/HAM1 family [Kocuria tytonicola]